MRDLCGHPTTAVNIIECSSKNTTLISKRRVEPSVAMADKLATRCTYHIRALRCALAARENYIAHCGLNNPPDSDWAGSMRPPISVAELRCIVQQGNTARKLLAVMYEGLVQQIVKRYQSKEIHGSTLSHQRLVQEGKMGVQEAADRFKPEKGYKFSTFALFYIRRRILRCLADKTAAAPLSVDVRTKLENIKKTKAQMAVAIGRPPSIPELAHRMNLTVENLAFMEYT
jgi:hypothetical protein